MKVTVKPGIPRGIAAAPPSKSMAHRLLICAGLSDGESCVRGVDLSEDILATIGCLRALGVRIDQEGDRVRVRGVNPRKAPSAELPCRESATTMRLMTAVCLLSGSTMRLTGSARLMQRPMSVYEELCAKTGLFMAHEEGTLLVRGPIKAGFFEIPGDVSSQFVSGLLLALPLPEETSVLRLIPPVESRSYIDMTLHAMDLFSVRAQWTDEYTLSVPGGQRYQAADTTAEGDYSNAAFLEALNELGGSVTVTGLDPTSLQGDRIYREHFRALHGPGAVIDLSDCPDLAPVLFAVAAAQHGAVFTGTRRLRLKESDRGEAMAQELQKFGISVTVGDNTVRVHPGTLKAPETDLSSHNDHRIAMALAVLAARTGGVIDGAEAVRKSWPGFWDALKSLQMDVTRDDCTQKEEKA